MKRGFTLIEMLVVVGIIAVLSGAAMATFSGITARAQSANAQELVHNVATALEKVLQDENGWPQRIISDGQGSHQVTSTVGAELARRHLLSLNYRQRVNQETGETVYELVGLDQCGVVSPWAAAVVKRRAGKGKVSLKTSVPSGGTIEDHVLRFAVDDDMDGIVHVGGDGIKSAAVRASAAVWCCGRDGKFGTKDDVKSWVKGQER